LDRDWYLVLIAGTMGMFIALAALAFILPLREAERVLEAALRGERPSAYFLVIGIPVVGALLTAIVLLLVPVRVRGHGVTQVLHAINRNQSHIPLKVAVRQWVGSSFTIASGGSAGPEGPIVTIGATLGSLASRWLQVDRPATTTLLGCGAAAGIAAVFAAPLTGIFFVLEVLLRDFSLRTFTPIVVASVLSFATIRAILGDADPVFGDSTELVRHIQAEISMGAVPLLAALALLSAGGAAVFTRTIERSEDLFSQAKFPRFFKPAIGALMLGLGAAAWMWVGGAHSVPPFLGAGYAAITHVLTGPLLNSNVTLLTAGLLFFWFGTKVVATALTLGSGGAGGLFAPALLAGASLGAAVGCLGAVAGITQPNPAACGLIGMGCMVAATTHAPLAGAMLVYELSHNETIILPALLCTVVSTLAGRALYPYSMYTAPLAAMGIRHGEMGDLTLLRRMTVADLDPMEASCIHPAASGLELLAKAEATGLREIVVMDQNGNAVGLVTSQDLQSLLVYREAAEAMTVSDVVRTDLPATWPDETLDVVFQKLAARDVETLIVMEERGSRKIVGVITRDQVVRAYDAALRTQA
jgi:CIC family chloride channel protein